MIDQQLFSLILYKNVNPCDFKLCHERKGNLYNLFENKEKIVSELSQIDPDFFSDGKKKTIKELLQKHEETIADILNVDKEEASVKLLFHFARHGYIDENYEDIISFMYNNQLEKYDYIFLRNLLDFTYNDFNQELKKPEIILDKIPNESYWTSPGILNYDLLQALLKKEDVDKIDLFTKVMLDNDCNNGQKLFFVNIKKKEKISLLLSALIHNISDYSLNNLFGIENLDILIQFLHSKESTEISALKSRIKNLWSEKEKLFYDDESIDKLFNNYSILNRFNLKFNHISKIRNIPLLWKIVDKELYEINIDNLKTIFKLSPDEKITLDICKKNNEVFFYINSNCNKYIQNVIENDDTPPWGDIISLITNPKIEDGNIYPLIKKMSKKINNLEECFLQYGVDVAFVPREVIRKLFKNEKIEFTEKNLSFAFKHWDLQEADIKGIDDYAHDLIDYVQNRSLNKSELRKIVNGIREEKLLKTMDQQFNDHIIYNIRSNNLTDFFIRKYLTSKYLGLYPKIFAKLIENQFDNIYKDLSTIPLKEISPYIFINEYDNAYTFWTDDQLEKIINRVNLVSRLDSYFSTAKNSDRAAFFRLLIKLVNKLDWKTLCNAYEILMDKKMPKEYDLKDTRMIKQELEEEYKKLVSPTIS